MRIIHRYILRSVVVPFGVSILFFTLLLLLLKLVKIAELVLVKGADGPLVLHLFGFLAVYLLNYTIPIASIVSVTLAFGRLNADNELMVLRASGISLLRTLRPVFTFGLLLSGVCLVLNEQVLPVVHRGISQTMLEIARKKPSSLLTPGTFVNYFEKYIIYINRIRGDRLEDIKIYETSDEGKTRIILAHTGSIRSSGGDRDSVSLALHAGRIDQPDGTKENQYMSLAFDRYDVALRLRDREAAANEPPDFRDMTYPRLSQLLRRHNPAPLPLLMEYHTRLSLAFASVVMILAGLAFSITAPRKEKSINFTYSLGVIVLYYVLSAAGVAASVSGRIPPALCAWFPNLFIGAAAVLSLRLRRT